LQLQTSENKQFRTCLATKKVCSSLIKYVSVWVPANKLLTTLDLSHGLDNASRNS